MKRIRLAAGLLGLLLLTGCGKTGRAMLPGGGSVDERQAQAELDLQLGLLKDEISGEERQAALDIWLKVKPLMEKRVAGGEWERDDYEWRLLRRLSRLYDDYTIKYLDGDEEGFGYRNPPERTVAVYEIGPGGALKPKEEGGLSESQWSEAELMDLWDQMLELLPEGAFDDFDQLTFFTDGPDETVAWVWALGDAGDRWEIALDPADSSDRGYFVETVLHEYCHYLTLNGEQVTYTEKQTVDTYNEYGMVSGHGSYIDDFYQAFWTGYADDNAVCEDTFNFFLRHYDDFIDPYASTDPSEDICEAFTFFILRPRDPGADEDVWSQKLDFFYDYPELVEFRTAVRDNLELGHGEWSEEKDREHAVLWPDGASDMPTLAVRPVGGIEAVEPLFHGGVPRGTGELEGYVLMQYHVQLERTGGRWAARDVFPAWNTTPPPDPAGWTAEQLETWRKDLAFSVAVWAEQDGAESWQEAGRQWAEDFNRQFLAAPNDGNPAKADDVRVLAMELEGRDPTESPQSLSFHLKFAFRPVWGVENGAAFIENYCEGTGGAYGAEGDLDGYVVVDAAVTLAREPDADRAGKLCWMGAEFRTVSGGAD